MRPFSKVLLCIVLMLPSFFSFHTFSQTILDPVDLNQISPKKLPYRLETVRHLSSKPDDSFLAADLNNDGVDELISFMKKSKIIYEWVYVQAEAITRGSIIFRENFPAALSIQNIDILDINEDGNKEIIVNELKKDTLIIHILDYMGKNIHSFVGTTANQNSRKGYDWICRMETVGLMDVNDDGHLDIIFEVRTDFAYQPRGIYAYDFFHKKFVWQYHCGFQPKDTRLFDINGDGKREILMGSSSPDNSDGVSINGTDDLHVYLTVLDSLGREITRQIIGGKYSNAQLFIRDMNKDGNAEMIIRFHDGDTPKGKDYVAIWQPLTGKIGPKIAMEKSLCNDLAFLDADKDGYDEVLMGWNDGTLELRNHRLELVRSRQFINFLPQNIVSLDLDSDGEREFALSGMFEGSGNLLILDGKLAPIALEKKELNFDIRRGALVDPGFGREKLFIAHGNYEKVLLKMEKNFLAVSSISWKWMGKGLVAGVLLSFFFITLLAKKRYADKLHRSLYSLMSSVPEGIMVLSADGKIVVLNQALEQLFHVAGQDVSGVSYKTIFSQAELAGFKNLLDISFRENAPLIEKEVIFTRQRSSVYLFVEIVPFSLAGKNRSGRLFVCRDITEIVQSKRTIAWGAMAQRLAHEIKTPLSTVMLSAQRLQMEYEKKPEQAKKVEKYLNNIIGQVERLRKVTDTFMKFVEIKKQKIEPVNINRLLEQCIDGMKLSIDSSIKINKEFAPDIPIIKADGQQLAIAFKNIIDNSLNAIREKGNITFCTRLVQSLLCQTKATLKNCIQIEIADTGIGIPGDQLSQLFQPFFSTSPGGTGLGLVITKKIIEDHNGEIKIVSEEGIGTTVFVTLPV